MTVYEWMDGGPGVGVKDLPLMLESNYFDKFFLNSRPVYLCTV